MTGTLHDISGMTRGPSRRPPHSLITAVAAVALWDTGKFRTDEIAHALRMPESEVEKVLNFIREERRSRT